MTRLITIFVISLFFSNWLLGQDIIVLQNGEEIKAIVKEVGTKEIKYVKFDNQNGPQYVAERSHVFMIKYENGTKDVFTTNTNKSASQNLPEENKSLNKPSEKFISGRLEVKQGFFSKRYYRGGISINNREFVNTLRTDPQAYAYYSKYGTNKIIDNFFGGLSMLGAIVAVSFSINQQNQPALISAIGGLLAGVISRVYDSRAKSNLELAILTYNKNLGE